MRYEYREAPEGINNPPTDHLKEALALACGLGALVVGAFLLLGLLADRLVERLSPEAERRLAGMIRIPVDAGSQMQDEQQLQKLLDQLASRLPAVKYPLRVKLARSPHVNAVALPGGTVVVYSGLLARIRSENELAMVLGHEAGHFAARDHLKGLGRALVILVLAAALFGGEGDMPSFLQNVVGVTEQRFSRAQEEAADRVGARLVNEQYGHAGGVVDFFETMEQEEHQSLPGAWFSSHPAHATRVASLKGLIAREGWKTLSVTPLNGTELAERLDPQRSAGSGPP